MSRFLYFGLAPSNGKMQRWFVESRSSGLKLGEIGWFGRWRQYVFSPVPETLFNAECMTDISAFIGEQMKNWREKKRAARLGREKG